MGTKLMGQFSRRKGRRGEQQLVLFLKYLGYHAERILNQAHTSGLPDVKAIKGDKTYTFELKTYQDGFKSVYDFYYDNMSENDILTCLIDDCVYVAISTNFKHMSEKTDWHFKDIPEASVRLKNRFRKLNAKRGIADFLVLKDNNKSRLFLKFWDYSKKDEKKN